MSASPLQSRRRFQYQPGLVADKRESFQYQMVRRALNCTLAISKAMHGPVLVWGIWNPGTGAPKVKYVVDDGEIQNRIWYQPFEQSLEMKMSLTSSKTPAPAHPQCTPPEERMKGSWVMCRSVEGGGGGGGQYSLLVLLVVFSYWCF